MLTLQRSAGAFLFACLQLPYSLLTKHSFGNFEFGGINGIATSMLHLICCIQSRREILKRMRLTAMRIWRNALILRPGDRSLMRGILQQQTVALENGETTSINHFYVTSIKVLSRSKRTSITVYKKGKTR
jgi:hypothetical protein